MNKDQTKQLTEAALNELVEALKSGKSDRLVQYLRCMGRFKQYSLRNLLLIAKQNPEATQVAGFHAWKKLKRTVRKGEKGIAILAPLAYRKQTAKNSSEDDQHSISGFRVVHVFDVEQTEGAPLPQLASPEGDPGIALEKLECVIRRNDIGLRYESLPAGTEGYSAGGRIVISDKLDATRRFSVLAHELAHEWLDHRADGGKETMVRETEAEAVAFVICTAHAISSRQSTTDYIQLYRGDSALLCNSLREIQRVAVRILDELNA